MMKKIILVLIGLSLFLILTGCGEDKKNVAPDNTLVIGMELAYPPFEMTDKDGKPAGISVDMAEALGKYLKRPVRIENISYGGLIPALITKKIDIVLSSMTISEERKKTVAFSDPYCKSYLTLLVNSQSDVKSAQDLNQPGRKVAVKKGTTGYLYALKNLTKAEVLVFDKESACVLEVTQGRADAFIYDQMTVFKNWQQNPETTRAILTPIDDYEYWGIALRKEDTELKGQINAFIKQYEEQKGFEKLAEKNLVEIKKEFTKRGLPFFFSSK